MDCLSSNMLFLQCFLILTFYVTDPEGIAGAQKSLGLGQEEKARRVR